MSQPDRGTAETRGCEAGRVSVLQFIASLVRSVAWPAAVVGLAVVFRQPVAAALSRPLKRAKGGPAGFELEWQFTEAATRGEVERIGVTARPDGAGLDERQRELEELARVAPDAVVMRSYQQVEREPARVGGDRRSDGGAPFRGARCRGDRPQARADQ